MEKGIEGNSGTDLIFLQKLHCSSLFNTKTAVLTWLTGKAPTMVICFPGAMDTSNGSEVNIGKLIYKNMLGGSIIEAGATLKLTPKRDGGHEQLISSGGRFNRAFAKRDKKQTMTDLRGISTNWFKNRSRPSIRHTRLRARHTVYPFLLV
jgi:hypothetical protein